MEYQLPSQPSPDQKKRFRLDKRSGTWRVDDFKEGINAWLPILKQPSLGAFWQALTDDIRDLRNDVAHSEPTQELMEDARRQMADVQLWSSDETSPTFLTQPLVQCVLRDLGEQHPDRLCTNLIASVRARLLETYPP